MERIIYCLLFSFFLDSCFAKFKPKPVDGDVENEQEELFQDVDVNIQEELEEVDFDISDEGLEILPDEDLNDNQEIEDELKEELAPTCGNLIVDSDEECDDGKNGNPDDGCKDDCTYSCHDNTDCSDSEICNGEETCNETSHTCVPGTPHEDGFVCLSEPRSICLSGVCLESRCGDNFVDTGAGEMCEPSLDPTCRGDCTYSCTTSSGCPDDGNICNGEEYCDDSTHTCKSRNQPAEGTECLEDPRKICISGTCQVSRCGDGYIDTDVGEECEDGNTTEGDGCDNDCTFSCHNDTECDDGHGCTMNICIISSHTCSFPLWTAGTTCRPSAGDCDIVEYCDGVNRDCPGDSFRPNGYVCRPSAGVCDVAETCSGFSPFCPSDSFLPNSTICRPSTGGCDIAEYCTGSSADCPVDITGISGVIAISASKSNYIRGHTCALLNTSSVKCWGHNWHGELGDGTYTDRNTPVNVTGLSSGVSAISAGGWHTCALLNTGGVKCWGYNNDGQLGDGTTTDKNTPVDVTVLSSGVSAISAGEWHTCALLNTGGVKCWGLNSSGQLGDGTTTQRNTPVDVTGLSSGVSAISAGWAHTCALLNTGGVKCWGSNGYGQLGDGTTTQRATPIDVTGLSSGVSAISAGGNHTCALLNTGGVKCWGYNSSGQLGDGTTTQRNTPVNVSGLSSGVSAISTGFAYTCALLNTGGIKCWGYNYYGQLGDGTTTQRATPMDVTGLSSGVSAISAGFAHTCALLNTGGVKCWGANGYGQLGDGTNIDRLTPVYVCQ